jgi:hypothetical protein
MASFLTYLTTRPFFLVSEDELKVMREYCLCSLTFVHINFVIIRFLKKQVNKSCGIGISSQDTSCGDSVSKDPLKISKLSDFFASSWPKMGF